ncbi:MAG TPA: hypothetical protein VK402_08115 [Blastococcus sp.]|nr:hypothetical protein [Blastococcus sp.]
MSTSASSIAWLPAALARAAVVNNPNARPAGPRHQAPEIPGMFAIATPDDLARKGRHAEPEWSREDFDPDRDDVDVLGWLGFADQN